MENLLEFIYLVTGYTFPLADLRSAFGPLLVLGIIGAGLLPLVRRRPMSRALKFMLLVLCIVAMTASVGIAFLIGYGERMVASFEEVPEPFAITAGGLSAFIILVFLQVVSFGCNGMWRERSRAQEG